MTIFAFPFNNMIKRKNIAAGLLLLTYIVVLLHNVFPHHHHGNSGADNCHIDQHAEDCHDHGDKDNFSCLRLLFHHENDNSDKSLICHFSDSFSKSNLANDFISTCHINGIKFFANISKLQFGYTGLHLLYSYHDPVSSRAPPAV